MKLLLALLTKKLKDNTSLLQGYTLLFLYSHFVCGAFNVFHTQYVVTLLLGVTGHVVERLAFCEQHFQNIALAEFRELNLCLHEGHWTMLFRDVQYFCCHKK